MDRCLGRHLSIHETQACARCVGHVRSDIGILGNLLRRCTTEALHLGIGSHAAWLAGPVANVEAWHHREDSALAGRIPKGWLEDNQHEYHPDWVLGCWELLVRQIYGHDLDNLNPWRYLDEHLTRIAQDPGIDFELLSRNLHQSRTMLEAALHDQQGPETGAPCPTCTRPLVKVYDVEDTTGEGDRWNCKTCKTWRSDEDYRMYVEHQFLGEATSLTASQIKAQYGIPEGTVRRWAAVTSDTDGNPVPARIRKRGHNDLGLQLYDVADVKTQIERRNPTKETA
jgi:hypothetical protein